MTPNSDQFLETSSKSSQATFSLLVHVLPGLFFSTFKTVETQIAQMAYGSERKRITGTEGKTEVVFRVSIEFEIHANSYRAGPFQFTTHFGNLWLRVLEQRFVKHGTCPGDHRRKKIWLVIR